MTTDESGTPGGRRVPTRPGPHVPGDGTAHAADVERARRAMLDDARPRSRTRIGADVVCEALIRQGVDVFFSYPGGVILPLYDVLGEYPEIRHVLVRHEQGGAHAADGYARVTGRVGVCVGTSGPGRHEPRHRHRHGAPRLGPDGRDHRQRARPSLIGKDAFQEIDINGITLPMTKHNYLVRDANDLPRVIAEAFHIARTGRPGPVHIDITKDALQQETNAQHPTDEEVVAGLPGFRPNLDGHGRQLKLAAAEIARAKRPVILAGHGVLHAEAWDDLRAFAEKTQIPVAHTLLGVGAIPEDHPLSYGFMGMHGWKHVNRAIQSADLLVAIGMRFDDRVTGNVRTYAPYARIVHVDIDPAEIGKNVAVEVPIVGDAGRVLRALLPMVDAVDPATRADYFAELAEWRRDSEGSSWHGSGAWRDGLLSADYVVEPDRRADRSRRDVRRRRRPEPDVARPLHRLPRAELARQLGRPRDDGLQRSRRRWARRSAGPDRETWAITGDGGFQMTSQELMTLVAGPHPGEDRAPRQQEARDDPPVAGDHLRRQLPLVEPARAGLREARRGLRDPGLPGPGPRTRSTTRSGPPRRSTGPPSSGSRSPRSRTSSR